MKLSTSSSLLPVPSSPQLSRDCQRCLFYRKKVKRGNSPKTPRFCSFSVSGKWPRPCGLNLTCIDLPVLDRPFRSSFFLFGIFSISLFAMLLESDCLCPNLCHTRPAQYAPLVARVLLPFSSSLCLSVVSQNIRSFSSYFYSFCVLSMSF